MNNKCKKCLLLEAGEKKAYNDIIEYLSNLPLIDKVDESVYSKRLAICKECDELISGMCRMCGCYVEIRAALKNKSCASYNDKKWEGIK